MTEIEIIDKTVEHFSSNPRSIGVYIDSFGEETSDCVYNGPNGEHCAFAFWCENPQDLREGYSAGVLIGDGTAIMKTEAQGRSPFFWNQIQRLHDLNSYWEDKGFKLSILGEQFVDLLKTEYS